MLELQVAGKRMLDIAAAAAGLIVLGPTMLAIAVALKLTQSEDAIFRQPRAGLDGRVFTIYKYRTMRDARDAMEEGASADRITPLGSLLRRTSLDELPQLYNVLRGDMSIVGPRPDLPHHVDDYTVAQRRRLAVRPGITGWAQVNGRNELTWPERMELDLEYLDGWTLRRDLAILVRTASLVLSGRGTGLRQS